MSPPPWNGTATRRRSDVTACAVPGGVRRTAIDREPRIGRLVDDGKPAAERDELGRRIIPGPALAAYARQVHRAERESTGSSARNRLSGIVTDVILGDVSAQVEIQAGPFRVVALVSRESFEELKPERGAPAIAVELQPGGRPIGVPCRTPRRGEGHGRPTPAHRRSAAHAW